MVAACPTVTVREHSGRRGVGKRDLGLGLRTTLTVPNRGFVLPSNEVSTGAVDRLWINCRGRAAGRASWICAPGSLAESARQKLAHDDRRIVAGTVVKRHMARVVRTLRPRCAAADRSRFSSTSESADRD